MGSSLIGGSNHVVITMGHFPSSLHHNSHSEQEELSSYLAQTKYQNLNTHLRRSGAFKLPCISFQINSQKDNADGCAGVVNKKKIHDGESFANRWSHPERRLFAGAVRAGGICEGDGGEIWEWVELTSGIRQFKLEWCKCAKVKRRACRSMLEEIRILQCKLTCPSSRRWG